MKTRVLFATVLLVLCTAAFAQQPDQKAMMDAMMKAISPGDAHKLLDSMAGTWDVKVSMWMDPSQPPQVSTGTSENSWVLGNRELMQKFTGTMMGMPFSGVGYTGYDNIKKQYWGTWMDNFSTSVMVTSGNTADNGKTWKFTGMMPDPMTGKDAPTEERLTVADKDHHTMEMWTPAPDGKMFKMMEIAYTRHK